MEESIVSNGVIACWPRFRGNSLAYVLSIAICAVEGQFRVP